MPNSGFLVINFQDMLLLLQSIMALSVQIRERALEVLASDLVLSAATFRENIVNFLAYALGFSVSTFSLGVSAAVAAFSYYFYITNCCNIMKFRDFQYFAESYLGTWR
ncbi:hypothetical protein K1719_028773 [Acacia pycnantha]|nr:hypothetical protein K1719_028773 [Acacia pycnantha]